NPGEDRAVMTADSIKRTIVACAEALGFDSCRIARAAPPTHVEEFRGWLREGGAGEMEWMERGAEKRCDPHQVLPGARSIIIVALNYWQGEEPAIKERRFTNRRPPDGGLEAAAPWSSSQRDGASGRIARYAWGDDYHDVML